MENKIIKVPNHLPIIMDGNGRWAKKKNKNRVFGHTKGINPIKKIVEDSIRLEIKYLTLYPFSTEN
jgi:Undecaprenyl pyrophosphate synthase